MSSIRKDCHSYGREVKSQKAAQFCTDNGKETERSTLDTKRSTGGGPPFFKKKGEKHVWYDTDDLLKWINSDAPMQKYNSTSEYSTRKKKTPKPNGATPEEKPPEDLSSDPSPDDGGDNE